MPLRLVIPSSGKHFSCRLATKQNIIVILKECDGESPGNELPEVDVLKNILYG